MTPEQKLANKQARQKRDQAYAERCRERAAAAAEVEARLKAMPEVALAQKADEDSEALRLEREACRKALLDQIAALEAQVREVGERFAPLLDAAREVRRQAHSNLHAARRALDLELDERFPDLKGVYGPAQWRQELAPEASRPKG